MSGVGECRAVAVELAAGVCWLVEQIHTGAVDSDQVARLVWSWWEGLDADTASVLARTAELLDVLDPCPPADEALAVARLPFTDVGAWVARVRDAARPVLPLPG